MNSGREIAPSPAWMSFAEAIFGLRNVISISLRQRLTGLVNSLPCVQSRNTVAQLKRREVVRVANPRSIRSLRQSNRLVSKVEDGEGRQRLIFRVRGTVIHPKRLIVLAFVLNQSGNRILDFASADEKNRQAQASQEDHFSSIYHFRA